jgi:hypothetical protein
MLFHEHRHTTHRLCGWIAAGGANPRSSSADAQGTKPLGKSGAMCTVFMHIACAEAANGGQPLQHPPCRQWDNFGACRRGEACFFRHDPRPEPSTGPLVRWEGDVFIKVRAGDSPQTAAALKSSKVCRA